MKECMIEGCHKKHHAKGYCKLHYTEYILKKRLENEKCSVPGCQNCVSYSFTIEKIITAKIRLITFIILL